MVTKALLAELEPGDVAIVQHIGVAGPLRRRLLDLGLVQNTQIRCVGKSPAGDPAAYLIRGAVIALRAADSARITVLKGSGLWG